MLRIYRGPDCRKPELAVVKVHAVNGAVLATSQAVSPKLAKRIAKRFSRESKENVTARVEPWFATPGKFPATA